MTTAPIDIGAVLEYRGSFETVQAFVAGGGSAVIWEIRRQDGGFTISQPVPGSCEPRAFEKDKPYWLPYRKGAAYDPQGPDAEFYRRFLSTPELFLPPGDWEVAGTLTMSLGSCTGPPVEVTLRMPFTVLEST